ncbi:hypothetical protein [Micromonospora sp. NBC_01796]|uniref:hypothetical protein n=1 Tax=Micromonospora sp. NBC_01796 TaxID=2975987 RepID=UPI002DDA02F1|nr:hypothetical protein [Micromonospora sp. NBC_01796]WSA83920.1 hypothetical protein OIE47_26605 [Micromonospora sp. NBC_01796]
MASLNRFRYQRLGPEPEFPVTILTGEGGSNQIWVDVLCAPAGSMPYHRPGPPWQVHTTISLSCDSDPTGCGGHQVDAHTSTPIETPLNAATEVHTATEWLLRPSPSVDTRQGPRQQPRRAGKHCPVGRFQIRTAHLPRQDRDLMPQHEHLDRVGVPTAIQQDDRLPVPDEEAGS